MIGAGAVGLAIARKLAERARTSTLLIERHGAVGTETSSRNSEAGLVRTSKKPYKFTPDRSFTRASTMVLLP